MRSAPAALIPRPGGVRPAEVVEALDGGTSSSLPLSALRLLPRRTAAATLSVSLRTLDGLVAAGKIRSVQIGDRRLFRPADLDAFVSAL